jgi:hypothetical protein
VDEPEPLEYLHEQPPVSVGIGEGVEGDLLEAGHLEVNARARPVEASVEMRQLVRDARVGEGPQ